MSTGLNDIEQEETPEEKVSRLFGEGVKLSDSDIYAIYNGTYREQRKNVNSNNNIQNQNGNGNITSLANSDPTNTNNTNNNVSGLQDPKKENSTPPPPPPPPVSSVGTYTIWMPVGESPHEDLKPHSPKKYRVNKFGEFEVEHTYKFCKCEGDPDNVSFIRSEARMGWAPRYPFGSKEQGIALGYYVIFPEKPDPSDPEGNYAPDYKFPSWILNQDGAVKYIGDDKCPEGKNRLTADGVQLGKIGVIEPPKEEIITEETTVTYQKVEIQPMEYIGYTFGEQFGINLPRIKSLKFPPVIIDSVTIPKGIEGTVVLDDIDIIRESLVTEGVKVNGDPPREIYDDIQIKPMTFLTDQIKIKNNVPITFRSITFPPVIIDSIDQPQPLQEGAEISEVVVSTEPILLPSRTYDTIPDNQTDEIQEGTKGEIKNDTVILKNVELKIPIRDRASGLKFWKVMTDKPEITITDEKNEELTLKIPNIMIPNFPKKQHTVDKMVTSKLTINKSLLDYVEDVPQSTEVAKDKYIIYTMEGKTVPDVGDVYGDDDNGERIYYGVNEPFRDKTPVKNDFEYCKCSGDDATTSKNRGYARLGILLAGNTNQKYFKRDRRDEIAGTLGKYIGDDKCPDGETQVINGQDASQGVVTLIPDKEDFIKLNDLIINTKNIVLQNETDEFKGLDQSIIENLPEITIKNIDIPLILEGGRVKSETKKVDIDFSKMQIKIAEGLDNIHVPDNPPKEEEQKNNVIKTEKGKSEKIGGGKINSKKNKPKPEAKEKGKTNKTGEKSPAVHISNPQQALEVGKGREIPKAPGISFNPSLLKSKGTLYGIGHGYHKDTPHPTYADWEWKWPTTYTFTGTGQTGYSFPAQKARDSRPSNFKSWWKYFSDYASNEPRYNWNTISGGGYKGWMARRWWYDIKSKRDEVETSVGFNLMWDEQYAPQNMQRYNKIVGNKPNNVIKPINWNYFITRNKSGWIVDNKGEAYQNAIKYAINNGAKDAADAHKKIARYPFMVAGKGIIRQYVPFGFGAKWNQLLSKFRYSIGVRPEGGSNGYGGPLEPDYQPSLLDVGILLNMAQSGYTIRYKLTNGSFPPLGASGTEQHVMMLDTINTGWLQGNLGYDPMVGAFNIGETEKNSVVVNWAHEPHWCGISTDFYFRKGGYGGQGTTSVKGNEEGVIDNGLPLNRPRLEDTIDAPWEEERWRNINGKIHGVGVRDLFRKAYNKFGPEHFEHPITPEYLEYAKKNNLNSIWFIADIHYDPHKEKITELGYNLLRKAINPEIIDWPACIVSHTGHVEAVLGLDVDGELIRLGGNTGGTGGGGGFGPNNVMGLFRTNLSSFGGYPPTGEREGFIVLSKPDSPSEAVKKHRAGPGISAPWIITPVIKTYMDFVENNPDPEYPVFSSYWQAINVLNSITNSTLR